VPYHSAERGGGVLQQNFCANEGVILRVYLRGFELPL